MARGKEDELTCWHFDENGTKISEISGILFLLVTIANASFLLHEAIKREKYWTSDLGRWRKLVVWISANMYEEQSCLSPNHWQHQDRLACVKHIQPSQTHLKLQALFYTQPKCHIKMAALMLPLAAEDTTEENRNTCMDQLHPTYHWRTQIIQENLDSCIKAQMAKKREENLKWEREIGSLIYATIAMNFDWTLSLKLTRLLSCDVQWVLSVGCHTYSTVDKTKDLPSLKNNASHLQFLRLLTTSACGRRARLIDSLPNQD